MFSQRKARGLTFAYLPESSGSNAYVFRMQEILSGFASKAVLRNHASFFRALAMREPRLDVIIANWIDNKLVKDGSGRLSIRGVLSLLRQICLLKLQSRRLILVRHNLYPHSADPRDARLLEWIVDRCESAFDLVVVHSGAHIQRNSGGRKRRMYLPHPLYSRASATSDDDRSTDLPAEYFLSFGRIAPYKNLASLMQAFPENKELVVSGDIADQRYADQLATITRPNVLFRPGLLSEARAQQLVSGCRAVVITHSDANVIVSGTFFYAISLRRPVFATRTPFLEWIRSRLDSKVLTLADSVADLADVLSDAQCEPIDDRSWEFIQREFGDDTIRLALAPIFANIGSS